MDTCIVTQSLVFRGSSYSPIEGSRVSLSIIQERSPSAKRRLMSLNVESVCRTACSAWRPLCFLPVDNFLPFVCHAHPNESANFYDGKRMGKKVRLLFATNVDWVTCVVYIGKRSHVPVTTYVPEDFPAEFSRDRNRTAACTHLCIQIHFAAT